MISLMLNFVVFPFGNIFVGSAVAILLLYKIYNSKLSYSTHRDKIYYKSACECPQCAWKPICLFSELEKGKLFGINIFCYDLTLGFEKRTGAANSVKIIEVRDYNIAIEYPFISIYLLSHLAINAFMLSSIYLFMHKFLFI